MTQLYVMVDVGMTTDGLCDGQKGMQMRLAMQQDTYGIMTGATGYADVAKLVMAPSGHECFYEATVLAMPSRVIVQAQAFVSKEELAELLRSFSKGDYVRITLAPTTHARPLAEFPSTARRAYLMSIDATTAEEYEQNKDAMPELDLG